MKIFTYASLLILWLSCAAAETNSTEYEEEEELIASVTPVNSTELAKISLRIYTGDTIDEYESALVEDAVDLIDYIDNSKPTVCYIFGWTETSASTSVETVVGAYLKRQDHNIILMNWEEFASLSYVSAAVNSKYFGNTMATAMDKMVVAGLNSSTLHIVSHSLGCQIAGYMARNVSFTVPRVTGLDPAGPGFYGVLTGLSSTDAEFVDMIHTDAGFYGTATKSGTVNFFPNNGTRFQPGCPTSYESDSEDAFCSHHRSWYYYAESLLDEDAFIGVPCNSYTEFEASNCSDSTVVMGYATPTTATGNYYLQTNNETLFGRGEAGTIYVA